MTSLAIASFIGLAVTLLGMIVGVATFMAAMKANTRELGRSIDMLRLTVDKLDDTIEAIQNRSNAIDNRLSVIEGKLSN